MESIGEKLKQKREELGLSIEQIARETNIARRYILGLEEENFSLFPGEPYLIGFLRTYSESIGLVPEEILALYRNFKIQELPLPMNELLQKRRVSPLFVIIIIVIVTAAITGGGVLLYPKILKSLKNRPEPVHRKEIVSGVSYNMTDEILERRFFEGDQIEVSLGENQYPVLLSAIAGEKITLKLPESLLEMDLGGEQVVDLDGDQKEDIKIFVRDLDANGEKKSGILRFDRFTQERKVVQHGAAGTEEKEVSEVPAEGDVEVEQVVSIPSIGSTNAASRNQVPVVLLESVTSGQITIDFTFRGYCLLRYLSDGQNREERYFHKGETFRLEAARDVMLWISNAGAIKARISGKEVEFGHSGEVSTKLIKWVKGDGPNPYTLQMLPVY